MSADGHPWLTEELDDLRRSQRVWLRSQPSWRVERVHVPRVSPDDPSDDDGLLETMLRWKAAEKIESLPETFGDLGGAIAGQAYEWTRAVSDTRQPFEDPLRSIVNELLRASEELNNRDSTITDEQWRPTLDVVALLGWADDFAEDGYTDPRLAEGRERARRRAEQRGR